MRMFVESLQPQPDSRILDLGGTAEFWAGTDLKVTLLNVRPPKTLPEGFAFVLGDATDLPFSDRSFDIVFSNSMIEHLGTHERQRRCAAEASRVGKRLWVQTPNRRFFIEPHYLTPFVHWLPPGAQRRVLRNFSVWGRLARPTPEYVAKMVEEIRLLSREELGELFPNCTVESEKVLGLTKSLIAVRQ